MIFIFQAAVLSPYELYMKKFPKSPWYNWNERKKDEI